MALPRAAITTWQSSGFPFADAQTSVSTFAGLDVASLRAPPVVQQVLPVLRQVSVHPTSPLVGVDCQAHIPCGTWPCNPFLGFSSPAMHLRHGSWPSAVPRPQSGSTWCPVLQFLFPGACLQVHGRSSGTSEVWLPPSRLAVTPSGLVPSRQHPWGFPFRVLALQRRQASSAVPSLLFLGGARPCERLHATSRLHRFVAGGLPVLHGCLVCALQRTGLAVRLDERNVLQERVLQAGIQGFSRLSRCATSTEAVKLSRPRTTLLGVSVTLQGLTSRI